MQRIALTFSILLISLASFGQINMTQGLQLYLPFNGNAQDASGNGNHGIVSGAILAQDQNGAANSAYYFDGVDDKIVVAHSSSISPTVMTVCAKVKMEGFYNGFCYNNVILNKGLDYNSSFSYYSLRTTATNTNGDCNLQDTANHNYRFDINGNGSLQMSTMNNTPYVSTTEDTWDCLVGTYDGTTQKIYVNGTLRYQNPVAQKPLNTSDLTIGWYKELVQYPFWFNGSIDEVRIYNRVLNSSEIGYYCSIPFPQAIAEVTNELNINISPNPASDFVLVDLNNISKKGTLKITSIEGRVLLNKKINPSTKVNIDISPFTKGIYLFTFEIENQTQTLKVLKD